MASPFCLFPSTRTESLSGLFWDPRTQPKHTAGAQCLLNDCFSPAKWACEEPLNMRGNSGGTVRGRGKWVLAKSPGLLMGRTPITPQPPPPSQIQALVSTARKGLGWKEQRRQINHTALALSQVLYFPEVMAKERKGRVRKGRQERARESKEVEERGQ